MPIDPESLLHWKIPPVRQQLTKRDTMLYALGVGLGADPCDEKQLRFVYEKDLVALPSMAITLGYPGPWYLEPSLGITASQTVHGEQGFEIHNPIPTEGEIVGETRVVDVVDKGPGKGALLKTECKVTQGSKEICTLSSTLVCRADGGFGGAASTGKALPQVPSQPAHFVCDLQTLPQAALIYRLSGDYNPLHAEPAVAREAGFKAPILHGRCTFSVAAHAILRTCCRYDPACLRSMEGRFTSPVFPGETIRTEMWIDGDIVSFRSTVVERNVIAINNGRARIEGGACT